jgi:uncharacterized protein (DUF1697 family)
VTTRVAFLRAVNLGKRTARSAQLVAAVDGLGYTDVWTHISSGNVVFDAPGTRTDLERELEVAFEEALGFEATTFVRTAPELRGAVAEPPFTVSPSDTYFITFLKDSLVGAKRKALEALSNDFDTLVVKGRDVHWRMHGKSTDTHLTTRQWDDIVGHHRSTSRNTNMLRKLIVKLDH